MREKVFTWEKWCEGSAWLVSCNYCSREVMKSSTYLVSPHRSCSTASLLLILTINGYFIYIYIYRSIYWHLYYANRIDVFSHTHVPLEQRHVLKHMNLYINPQTHPSISAACLCLNASKSRWVEKVRVINDSAAWHLSIDIQTPSNEGWCSLGFIKVAAYEILKWAWLHHNTGLHRTGRDLPRKNKTTGGGFRRSCTDYNKDSGFTHIRSKKGLKIVRGETQIKMFVMFNSAWSWR